MPGYNYDVYVDDELVAVVFEEDLALQFIKGMWRLYDREDNIRYTVRRREKGVAIEPKINKA